MRITGFKVIKENKEHWTKHIQATVILDDDTFDIVFQVARYSGERTAKTYPLIFN